MMKYNGAYWFRVIARLPLDDTSNTWEGIAVDAQGNIYGAEVGPRQVVKHVRTP